MNNVKASVSNEIVNELGQKFPSIRKLAEALHISKKRISNKLRAGEPFVYGGHTYTLSGVNYVGFENVNENTETNEQTPVEYSQDYKDFLNAKKVSELPFEKFKFNKRKTGTRYAIALFSDAHIEETVKSASVMGLNEYNVKIARERIEKYFANLVSCLNTDKVEYLLFANLGDNISGFIHEELSQSNELTPLEATFEAQNLIYNGLKYICDNTELKRIKFVGIVGNHSRVTNKIQHSNGYKMSYEWLMYKNIQKQAELEGLPIEFDIPESEMAIEDTSDGKRFDHWYYIEDGEHKTFAGVCNKDIDVYASWVEVKDRFHLDENGDVWFEGDVKDMTSIPVKEGYEFDGWYVIIEGERFPYKDGLGTDVYASWKRIAPPSDDGGANLILPIVTISSIIVMVAGVAYLQRKLS